MKYSSYLAFFFVVLWACEETDGPECPDNASCLPPEATLVQELESLREQIFDRVETGSCDRAESCLFLPLGSKPCGGPWSYLIYSSSVDTAEVRRLVNEYNDLEAEINRRFERGSDCAVPNPPDSLECESGKCVGYYDGKAFKENECCND